MKLNILVVAPNREVAEHFCDTMGFDHKCILKTARHGRGPVECIVYLIDWWNIHNLAEYKSVLDAGRHRYVSLHRIANGGYAIPGGSHS